MKKLIYCAAALVTALFAGSCQRELLDTAQGGSTVTYTVDMPQVATKAVGEADYVNNLVYAVYRVTNTSLTDEQAKATLATVPGNFQLIYQEDTPVVKDNQSGKKLAHISLELINDQRYVVIFWAQKDYTWFNKGDSFTTVTYPARLDGNNDAYDAFTNVDVISVDGSFSKDVTLVRPFAQLNIATVVPGPTQEYPNRYTDFKVSTTAVEVDGVARSFNVGAQVGESEGKVDFAAAAPISQEFNATYPAYISMNYVFVLANQSNVTVSYDINTNNYGTVENTVPNVPLARNYRTNIIGNLLTSDVDYNVELAPWYENSNSGTTEVIVDGLVKNQKGDYEISTDNGLIHAINNLWVDEHGVANSATFYVYPQEYNITDDQIRDIHVTSGTLKVIKDVPVMTRSIVFDGIVIKGLSKPLIATVGEEATVVISGVTIQNYEGDGQQGALIGENDGKVIIEDCAIVDETGASDETTELVGDADDNGVVTEPEFEVAGNSAVVYDAAQLAAAFAAAEVENIVLGANIAVEETLVFPEGRTATLDLKGFELKTAENLASVAALVAVNGELTITDSYGIGRITATKISAIQVNNGGELAINCNVTAHESVVRAVGGEVVISGGKYVQTGTYYSNPSTLRYALDSRADNEGNLGSLTVNGGEFSSNNGIINAGANVTINGGTFRNVVEEAITRHLMYVNGSAVVNINGGEFHGEANGSAGGTHICVYTSKASVNITDGKFTSLWYNGGANTIIEEYSAGSTISVTGGTYNTKNGLTKYIHKDYKAVNDEETTYYNVVAKVYIVEAGDNKYETLQEAFNAGGDITLLKDIQSTEALIINEEKTVVLNLAGYTLTLAEAITNNGSLTISGEGTVTNNNDYIVENKGELVVDGPTLNGLGVIRSKAGKVTIQDGIFTASSDWNVGTYQHILKSVDTETVINGGTFDATIGGITNAMINVSENSTVTINGGVFINVVATEDIPQFAPYMFTYEKNGKLVIQDGEFYGGWRFNGETATTDIYGGNFTVSYDGQSFHANSTHVLTVYGGTFSLANGGKLNPTNYKAEGTVAVEGDNTVTIAYPVAKVGSNVYATIDEAVANWTNGSTLTLLAKVTLTDVITLKSTEYHVLDLGTYTMTAAKGKDAISITAEGRSSASYALDIKADATNPGGITATSKAVVKTTGKSGVKDRPIIRFYNGVYNASNVISHSGSNGTNCPQFQFHDGVYNANLSANRALIQIYGGTFNGKFYISVDSSAYCLISRGKFKYLDNLYGSALNSDKFTIGPSKGSFTCGVYVDDESYFVVGGAVITEFGDKYKAKATNASKAGSYLPYSSAAEHGLYYTNAEAAIAKHGEDNVVLPE